MPDRLGVGVDQQGRDRVSRRQHLVRLGLVAQRGTESGMQVSAIGVGYDYNEGLLGTVGIPLSIGATLLLGAGVGLANGLIVTRLGVPKA